MGYLGMPLKIIDVVFNCMVSVRKKSVFHILYFRDSCEFLFLQQSAYFIMARQTFIHYPFLHSIRGEYKVIIFTVFFLSTLNQDRVALFLTLGYSQ